MQTDTHHQQATVVLKDGNSPLATWIHISSRQPTIGEHLDIPAHLMADFAGYESRAAVARIQRWEGHEDVIELEAECLTKTEDRPVIVINSNRVRESLRKTAEAHLRSVLRFPLIQWEASAQADPVVRYHDPVSGVKACPASVRAGILDLLYSPASA